MGNVLLVPGTSGTKLLLDSGNGSPVDIGWPGVLSGEAWLCADASFDALTSKLGFTRESIIETLSMEHADANSTAPTRTTLKANATLAPGPVIHAAYNQFQDASVFSYDWRGDVRESGKKLAAHLANTPAGTKWKIVTHSQGGLVLVAAAKLLATQAGGSDIKALSKVVSHAALCACPLYGTVNAADALANGSNLSERFHASFLQISKTWPALYQMLPGWPASVQGDGGPRSLLDDAAWAGLDIDLALLARARETRAAYFETPFAYFSGVKLRLTMSMAQPTHFFMQKQGNAFKASGAEPGDTLVPYETTRAQMNDVERQATLALGHNHDVAEHFMILNDPAVASDIRKFFTQ